MKLFLTMAGPQPYSREGFKTPAYLLPWGDGTVLSRIIDELRQGDVVTDVVLAASHRDEAFGPHVRGILRARGIHHENLIFVGETAGQAATAEAAMRVFEERHGSMKDPVLIHNVDTILLSRSIDEVTTALSDADGYVDVFRANDHKYSYVLLDEHRRVIEIAEKIVISDTATSGLYGFKSVETFRTHYDASQDGPVSAIYRRMLKREAKIVASRAHGESDTVVIGAPEDYWNASVLLG